MVFPTCRSHQIPSYRLIFRQPSRVLLHRTAIGIDLFLPPMERTVNALLIVLLLSLSSRAQGPDEAAIFSRATEAMQQGNLEEAGNGFAAVIKQVPTFSEAHFNLGLVRQEQG